MRRAAEGETILNCSLSCSETILSCCRVCCRRNADLEHDAGSSTALWQELHCQDGELGTIPFLDYHIDHFQTSFRLRNSTPTIHLPSSYHQLITEHCRCHEKHCFWVISSCEELCGVRSAATIGVFVAHHTLRGILRIHNGQGRVHPSKHSSHDRDISATPTIHLKRICHSLMPELVMSLPTIIDQKMPFLSVQELMELRLWID